MNLQNITFSTSQLGDNLLYVDMNEHVYGTTYSMPIGTIQPEGKWYIAENAFGDKNTFGTKQLSKTWIIQSYIKEFLS